MAIKKDNYWLDLPPIIKQYGNITVLRDDCIDGGSKIRFLPFLIEGAKEVVFGGPFCGGAPYSLSVIGRETGVKVSLFYAKRKERHKRQVGALKNGAEIHEVPFGYMTNVQAKARRYAEEKDALFLPLGFDVPEAEEPFLEFMNRVKKICGGFDEIWCAVGSGMLAKCLSLAFPDAEINGVTVGLKSRHNKQEYGSNVKLHDGGYKFEKAIKQDAPFPSCVHYDGKAWSICQKKSVGKVLFWNVMS